MVENPISVSSLSNSRT